MKASTELFLWQLYWVAESVLRPGFFRWTQSFESWAYQRGILRQLQRLEAEAFLERQLGGRGDRIYRLTPKGRLAALGGKDPEELWWRQWDRRWRLLMFDMPATPARPRQKLRRFLREHGLGCLQGSVWVSPDSLEPIRKQLKGDRHPASLLLFEGTATGGEKDREIVADAWDFEAIDVAWSYCENSINNGKKFLKTSQPDADTFRTWIEWDFYHWRRVLEIDPFLPGTLQPKRYRGPKIWTKRKKLYFALAQKIRENGFKPNDDSRQ